MRKILKRIKNLPLEKLYIKDFIAQQQPLDFLLYFTLMIPHSATIHMKLLDNLSTHDI